jgi:hypothetical protein
VLAEVPFPISDFFMISSKDNSPGLLGRTKSSKR